MLHPLLTVFIAAIINSFDHFIRFLGDSITRGAEEVHFLRDNDFLGLPRGITLVVNFNHKYIYINNLQRYNNKLVVNN